MAFYITKGAQLWNADRTQGYEITEDIQIGDPVRARQFRALAAAPKPKDGQPLPNWLGDIIAKSKT